MNLKNSLSAWIYAASAMALISEGFRVFWYLRNLQHPKQGGKSGVFTTFSNISQLFSELKSVGSALLPC